MGFLKSCKKYIFPGHFKTLIENIKEAFDEKINNEKQNMYIRLKKDFEKLRKDKNNSCNNNTKKNNNNNSDTKKKIGIVSLLFTVLENEIELNKLSKKIIYASKSEESTIISKIKKIKAELNSAEEKLDDVNTTINSIHKSKDFLTKKIEEMLEMIDIELKAKSYVNSVRNEGNSVSRNIEKRLKKLMSPMGGGNRTRKNMKK